MRFVFSNSKINKSNVFSSFHLIILKNIENFGDADILKKNI